jgi:hypothetical protein
MSAAETSYQVVSALDGWVIDVYDDVPREAAQLIADELGVGIDYITGCDLEQVMARVAEVREAREGARRLLVAETLAGLEFVDLEFEGVLTLTSADFDTHEDYLNHIEEGEEFAEVGA